MSKKAAKKTVASLLKNKKSQASHIVVEALAGCGKTFTEIVGVVSSFAPSLVPELAESLGFEIVPSPEQKAVWERMAEVQPKTVTYCAFNKSIVTSFGEEYGWVKERLQDEGLTLNFCTINSLGNSVCRRALNLTGWKSISKWTPNNILSEVVGLDWRELLRKDEVLANGVIKLVSHSKLGLIGWTPEDGFDAKKVTDNKLQAVATHHGIELNGHADRAYFLTREVLRRSADVEQIKKRNAIDFDDQNWLPVILDLPVDRVDFLLVDEGQDLPISKQVFAHKVGRIVMLVGDVNQAIYGFAGADVDSIPRMKKLLGVVESLTLTETRRCSKAVVKEANMILQHIYSLRNEKPLVFTAHEDNLEGAIRHTPVEKYADIVEDGDMVLCRVNAPLVSQALSFLREGRKAVIRGREFGSELVNFVKKFKVEDVPTLIEKIDDWYHAESQKEASKKNPSDTKLQALEDKRLCIDAFSEGLTDVSDVIDKINILFTGKQCPSCKKSFNEETSYCPCKECKGAETDPVTGYPTGPKLRTPEGTLFSTVHKAKGLEAPNVFLLNIQGSTVPHPMAKLAWEIGQEYNLKYVAVTRAKNEFHYVTDSKTK